MKLAKALSARLKALREAKGLSQQDLAVKADLSLSLVSKMEQGKKADPRVSTLLALVSALDVSAGEVLDNLIPATSPASEPAEEEPVLAGKPAGKEKRTKTKRKKKG